MTRTPRQLKNLIAARDIAALAIRVINAMPNDAYTNVHTAFRAGANALVADQLLAAQMAFGDAARRTSACAITTETALHHLAHAARVLVEA